MFTNYVNIGCSSNVFVVYSRTVFQLLETGLQIIRFSEHERNWPTVGVCFSGATRALQKALSPVLRRDGKTYANEDGDGGTLSDPTPGLSEHYHSHSPSVSLPQCESRPPRALSTDFLVNRESENSVSFSFEGQGVGATAYKRETDDRGGSARSVWPINWRSDWWFHF